MRNGRGLCGRGFDRAPILPPFRCLVLSKTFHQILHDSTCESKIVRPVLDRCGIQESEGPFPWSSTIWNPGDRKKSDETKCNTLPSWVASLPATLQSDPGLQAIAFESAAHCAIEFKIPKAPMTAGQVLQHCLRVSDQLFGKHDPMIFKFGYTHNPCWRWANKLYGYVTSREKWSNMVVLWVSEEPAGPAMLESALIEIYKSI